MVNCCSICGKKCRGKKCKACFKQHSKKSDTCYVCGAHVSPKSRPSMCRKCASKVVAEKLKDKSEHPDFFICVQCGKKIPWLKCHRFYQPKYCSTSCFMLHEKISTKHTKESLTALIENFIKDKKKYVTVSEVCRELKISEKSIYKHHICVKEINEKYGLFQHEKKPPVVREDPHVNLKERILSFIKSKGTYVPIRVILDEFHIDFYSTWVNKFHFNITELNRECGFVRTTASFYEEKAFAILQNTFGPHQIIRQKRFDGCVGVKGWALRFDFYVKSKNALIEIDGEQHYNPENTFFKETLEKNDSIKNEFAKSHNIPLYRIPITPSKTFEERLIQAIQKL